MRLGDGSDRVLSCAKMLDAAPRGTIIRNSCDTDSDLDVGVYFQKIEPVSGDLIQPVDWVMIDPLTGNPWIAGGGGHVAVSGMFRSRDIFLPAQAVPGGRLQLMRHQLKATPQ